MRAGLGADRLQAGGHARPAACGDEQAIAARLTAVLDGQDVVLAVPPSGGRVHAEYELDAVAAQDLAERLAERSGLPAEHVPAAL